MSLSHLIVWGFLCLDEKGIYLFSSIVFCHFISESPLPYGALFNKVETRDLWLSTVHIFCHLGAAA